MANRTIKVDYIARVEGESSLELQVRNGAVDAVRLSIFEPPRFFEALLRGRRFDEVLDIVARICGICPIAYQMSGVHAVENALGIAVDAATRALRRLFYCGEWIQSHALHIVMLHAPDFLGYPDAITMARDHGAAVERALALKKTGNELIRLLGGRAIHPINARIGGFYRVPSRAELAPVEEALKQARDRAIDTLRWVAGFTFPECARNYEFVALRHSDEYPMNEGKIVSSAGLDIAVTDYETAFIERQVPHSTALHSVMKQRGAYLVGPMARYALNRDRLPAEICALADEVGLEPVCRNPFRSILVRAIEVVYACDEALRLIATYEPPARPFIASEPRAAVGHACTRRRAGSSITAIALMRRARSLTPASCRRRHKTKASLKKICGRLRMPPSISKTMHCKPVASKASATMTLAFPARRIS